MGGAPALGNCPCCSNSVTPNGHFHSVWKVFLCPFPWHPGLTHQWWLQTSSQVFFFLFSLKETKMLLFHSPKASI